MVLVKQLLALNGCCGEDKVTKLLTGFRHLVTKQVLLFLQAVSV